MDGLGHTRPFPSVSQVSSTRTPLLGSISLLEILKEIAKSLGLSMKIITLSESPDIAYVTDVTLISLLDSMGIRG